MGGWAFLAGIVMVAIAWLFGRKNGTEKTTTKLQGQITIEQEKAEKAEKEKDLAVSAAKIISGNTAEEQTLNDYFEEFETKLEEAKGSENPAASAIEAAKALALQAENWRQRNL